jgi:uncharacterized protein
MFEIKPVQKAKYINWFRFFVFCVIIKIFFVFVIHEVFYAYSLTEVHQLGRNEDDLENIILILLIAPVFETLLFQFGVIEITHIFLKRTYLLRPTSIILSSLLFGFSHFNGNAYLFVNSLMSGVILSSLYLTAMKKDFFSFLSTSLTHIMSNLFVFIMNK